MGSRENIDYDFRLLISSSPTYTITKMEQEEGCMPQFFSVTATDILELAYWTGCTGLANNSLTPPLSFKHFYLQQIADTQEMS